MKIESISYGPAELATFLSEIAAHDREVLVARLVEASDRLAEIAPQVPEEAAGPGPAREWSAKEVLAHIAVLSKFYGVVAYKVGTGAMSQLDLQEQVRQRDVAGERMLRLPVPEIAALARQEHRRTLAWLREAAPADLRRRCDMGGPVLTAEEVVRLTLCAHLELHLSQLAAALPGSAR